MKKGRSARAIAAAGISTVSGRGSHDSAGGQQSTLDEVAQRGSVPIDKKMGGYKIHMKSLVLPDLPRQRVLVPDHAPRRAVRARPAS
jgi:hypothetical protein